MLGVFSPSLEDEFGWTRAEVALAITLGSGAAALASPAIGWAIDRWGGRWVMTGSALIMGAALLVLAGMDSLWQLLLFYAIGRALSIGALTPAAFVAVSNWYVRRRSFVGGIVAVGPRVGMALFPLVAALVISATGNWRAGWVALAAIIFTFGVLPPLLLMKRRPEDVGLRPDGDPPEVAGEEPRVDLEGPYEFTLREAARTRAYWSLGVGLSFILFAGGAINFHQIPHLVDQGLPRTQAAFVVTVFSGMGAVGAFAGGLVAARWSVRWTMAVALGAMSVAVLILAAASTLLVALLYAVTYGGVFGAMVALEQVVYADYFGRRSMGLIRGSFQPVQMGMNAIGPYLTGLWVVATGSYTLPFVGFALLFALAALALVLAPYPRRPMVSPASP